MAASPGCLGASDAVRGACSRRRDRERGEDEAVYYPNAPYRSSRDARIFRLLGKIRTPLTAVTSSPDRLSATAPPARNLSRNHAGRHGIPRKPPLHAGCARSAQRLRAPVSGRPVAPRRAAAATVAAGRRRGSRATSGGGGSNAGAASTRSTLKVVEEDLAVAGQAERDGQLAVGRGAAVEHDPGHARGSARRRRTGAPRRRSSRG